MHQVLIQGWDLIDSYTEMWLLSRCGAWSWELLDQTFGQTWLTLQHNIFLSYPISNSENLTGEGANRVTIIFRNSTLCIWCLTVPNLFALLSRSAVEDNCVSCWARSAEGGSM